MLSFNNITISEDIENAANHLQRGGVICYPTDTIWGLGCDATQADAVDKIYKIKHRDVSKSMLILANSMEMVKNCVITLPDIAIELFNNTCEPLTIILQGAQKLAENLPALDNSIGVRIVKHPFCTPLLQMLGKPIVSTSANFSEQPTPAKFDEIDKMLLNMVDYVAQTHRTQLQGKPSKILMITEDYQVRHVR